MGKKSRVKKTETHKCTIGKQTSESFLPPLDPQAGFFQRYRRALRKLTLISEKNPQSTEYFRSNAEILRIRREHVEMNNCIIHPFSMFRMYYEIYMTVALLVIILYMPVAAGFDLRKTRTGGRGHVEAINIVNIILKLLCIIDIVMNFFTGYPVREQRMVIMKPRSIAKKYVLSVFFISDLMSSIPEMLYDTEGDLGVERFFDFFGLLKIVRLPTLFFFATRSAEVLNWRGIGIHLLRGFVVTYIVFHWFACAQYLIPQIRPLITNRRRLDRRSWIVVTATDTKQFLSAYLVSFYRASGYILCINIENMKLTLWEEKMLAIFTFLFGKLFVFYYTVLLLQQLLSMRSLEVKYFATISQVKSYMRQKQLPMTMQKRIMHYYSYKYNNRYFKEESITGLLSEKLKGEINLSVCSKLVQSVELIAELPDKQLEQIVTSLRAEIHLPNDIIIKAGAVGDCMYFLACGTVAVWTPSGKEVCHLQDGAYFGEISLIFKDKKRTATIVAIEICEVYKLERKAFRNCFRGNMRLLRDLEEVARQRLETTQMYEDIHTKQFFERELVS